MGAWHSERHSEKKISISVQWFPCLWFVCKLTSHVLPRIWYGYIPKLGEEVLDLEIWEEGFKGIRD